MSYQKDIKKYRQIFDQKVYAIPYAGDMFEELATKIVKKLLKDIKNGKLCLNCGNKKFGNLIDMCDKCLED